MNTISRPPSLNSLKVFQVAGRHLSFKRAADELFITPSAVSHQVRNLENRLGTKLFLRKTRALDFTEAGKRYFDFLDGMFARLEAETHQLFVEYGRGLVRLCVPPFFASEMLLPRLENFQTMMPHTDIRLTTQTSSMQTHPSEADLSVLLGKGDWPNLVSHRLFPHRLVAACAPDILNTFDRDAERPLDGQTLIVHENRPQTWEHWARALKLPSPRPAKIIRFDSMTAVVQAAMGGLGIAIVSWPLSRARFESTQLVRVVEQEVESGESFFLAHRPGEDERTDVERLIGWLTEQVGTREHGCSMREESPFVSE